MKSFTRDSEEMILICSFIASPICVSIAIYDSDISCSIIYHVHITIHFDVCENF